MKRKHSNQRNLILMRHAEAETHYSLRSDFNRNLTDQGILDANNIAGWLNNRLTPEKIICSAAYRAYQTGLIVSNTFLLQKQFFVFDELYQASAVKLKNQIETESSHIKCLVVVGHNPGIEQLALSLCPDLQIYNNHLMSTASVVWIEVDSDWQFLAISNCRLVQYISPKMLHKSM